MQVAQHAVGASHPLLDMEPSGMVVRQSTASRSNDPSTIAPVRLASTRQVSCRFVPERLACRRSAPRRLALSRLQPLQVASRKASDAPKLQEPRLRPLLMVQDVLSKQRVGVSLGVDVEGSGVRGGGVLPRGGSCFFLRPFFLRCLASS